MATMMTSTQLKALLLTINVRDISAASKVSTKTIYRIRQDKDYSPTIRTVERLVRAIGKSKTAKA